MSDISKYVEFYARAGLDPTLKYMEYEKRGGGYKFADIEIVDCQYKDWWYASFIGIRCLVVLWVSPPENNIVTIRECHVVTLTNTRFSRGRKINIKDVIIL